MFLNILAIFLYSKDFTKIGKKVVCFFYVSSDLICHEIGFLMLISKNPGVFVQFKGALVLHNV